tara:strand:- start:6932 stop:7393 length:462 start_codon:yes stop_codon:yes gene_type:complete
MAKSKGKSPTKVLLPYDRALRIARRAGKPTEKAYDLLLEANLAGDPRAAYALATWHLFGSPFTPINYKKAFKLLKVAAAANISEAVYALGVSYERGAGVTKSEKNAFVSYMHAALLGNAEAHYAVGKMYYHGLGTTRNRQLAGYWLDKADVKY